MAFAPRAIVVHGSYTPPDMDIGLAEIADWHRQREIAIHPVGYHFIVRRDGTVERGRPITQRGAHAYGANGWSLGICLVGGMPDARLVQAGDPNAWDFNYTGRQMDSLWGLVRSLRAGGYGEDRQTRITEVIGHRDVPGTKKDCPGFDVAALWGELEPPAT